MQDTVRLIHDYPKPLTDDPQGSFTLPSRFYTDAAVYELEKERIFYRTWQYVAHRSFFDKAGDYITVQICDQDVFVIQGKDGEVRAFYNVCQHRAHELLPPGRGHIRSVIVCPYHAWSYEREGELRAAPRSQHRLDFNNCDYSLKPVRLEWFLDCVFINLDPNAQPLSELAGDLEQEIRQRVPFYDRVHSPVEGTLGATRIEAGWKVVVDNYVECYHCDHAHPDFASLINMDSYQHDTFGLWSRQLGEDIRPENSAYALTGDEPAMFSAFWFLWPNTTFNILPGKEEINIGAIRPLGPAVTDFGGHNMSTTGDHNPSRADYTADVLVPEDIALCESVQRGLRSKGYDQGPMMVDDARSGRGEQAIHHFHRLVQKALM